MTISNTYIPFIYFYIHKSGQVYLVGLNKGQCHSCESAMIYNMYFICSLNALFSVLKHQ